MILKKVGNEKEEYSILKKSKYILVPMILFFVLPVLNTYLPLLSFKDKLSIVFSISSIIILSFSISISYRDYKNYRTTDYLYFGICYFVIIFLFSAFLIDGVGARVFKYYYFNFIKLSEVLIYFFGIFLLKERFHFKNLYAYEIVFFIMSFIVLIFFIRFSIFFPTMVIILVNLIILYNKLMSNKVKLFFTDIMLLKIFGEFFDIFSELNEADFFYLGSFIMYLMSFIKLFQYFNFWINKAYIDNFYLNEKRINSIMNMSSDGIIVLSEYFIKKINKKALEILEIENIKNVKGKNMFSIFDKIKQEDIDSIVSKYPREILQDIKVYNQDSKKVKFVGTKFSSHKSNDIILFLRKQDYISEFFYKINENADYFSYIYDRVTQKYIYVAPSAFKFCGYEANEFYRDSELIFKIVEQKDCELYFQILKSVGKPFNCEIETKYYKKDKSFIWVMEKVNSLIINEREAIYGVVFDISKLKSSLEMVQNKNIELENQILTRDTRFAYVVHEIKNPLTAIMGFTENLIINKKDMTPKNYGITLKIYNNAYRLKEMVENFLDLNKINAGKITINKETLDLRETITNILSNVEILLESKNIKIENNIKEGTYFYVDEAMFYQIAGNIISNAIKYNNVGGKIIFEAESSKEFSILKISDTGTGIKEEDAKNIFNEYERGTGVKEKGTGLGLSVTKKMVELHGGEITFETKLNFGTTFILKFPKKINTEEEIPNFFDV